MMTICQAGHSISRPLFAECSGGACAKLLRRTPIAALCGMVLFFSLTTPALAEVMCAVDGAQLQAKLNEAASNGEDDLIKLEPGLYKPTDPMGFFATLTDGHGLAIGGGFDRGSDNTFCADQLRGAQWSTLDGAMSDGTNNRRLLNIHFQNAGTAPFTMYNLSFKNGKGTAEEPVVHIDGEQGWSGDIFLESISVRDNEMDSSAASFETAGRIIVRGSEFVRNSGLSSDAFVLDLVLNNPSPAAANEVIAGGAGIYLNNTTIAGNDMPDNNAQMQVGIESDRDVRIANTIIYGSSARDLFYNGPHLYLDNSDVRGRFIFNGFETVTEANGYYIHPAFVSTDDFHLAAPSVLIGGGMPNPLGGTGTYDVTGSPRVVGVVDVGAYESAATDMIFENGFEWPPTSVQRDPSSDWNF